MVSRYYMGKYLWTKVYLHQGRGYIILKLNGADNNRFDGDASRHQWREVYQTYLQDPSSQSQLRYVDFAAGRRAQQKNHVIIVKHHATNILPETIHLLFTTITHIWLAQTLKLAENIMCYMFYIKLYNVVRSNRFSSNYIVHKKNFVLFIYTGIL